MHPKTLELYEALKARNHSRADDLCSPHQVSVSESICEVASAICRHEAMVSTDETFRMPVASRPPSGRLVLITENRIETKCWLIRESPSQRVYVDLVLPVTVLPIGGFDPGGQTVELADPGLVEGVDPCAAAALFARTRDEREKFLVQLAFVLSLLNEPSRVERASSSGYRAHRRRVQRATGKAALAWTAVTWTLGAKVCAKRVDEGTGHPKALHWCRGHWRRSSEHAPSAKFVRFPSSGRSGWHVWVRDCWKGHPDYGIKLQRHQPELEGQPRPLRTNGCGAVIDDTRWAAMSAAQRRALVEAGHAPNATLH